MRPGSYQSTKVVPDLGNVRIKADSPRVRVQSVAILVDLVIQNTYAAPECRVLTVTIDCLLIGFVCFGVLLL